MSSDSPNPFITVSEKFKGDHIERFNPLSEESMQYLSQVQDNQQLFGPLFIGWVCEPNTFFAYLHMGMKKQAREERSTEMAAEMAQAGFPVLLPQINQWIKTRRYPILFVPVASRYGASERFTTELLSMVGPSNEQYITTKHLFEKLDKSVEVKSVYSWPERNLAVKNLFSLIDKPDLSTTSILLVDDFISSGSSLRESAMMLTDLGAKDVAAIALSTNLFIRK